ncbi:MAG: MFS transporter [Acidimicrobiia bacterium]
MARSTLGPNYWKLLVASAVSNFGDGLSAVAYPWLASAVTRDPVQISLIGVASRLPWLVFTLPAGVITDRVDRRKLIASMDVARFLITVVVAVVVLLGRHQLADPEALAGGTEVHPEYQLGFLILLYGSALLFGIAEVLRDNAAQTLMPAMVAPEQLEKANGRLWGAEMVMNSFVGPPLGGILVGFALALPFFIDAGTFGASAILIYLISGSFRATGWETRAGKISWRAEMGEGLRWLWNHRLLRAMGLILGASNAMFSVALATYVLFVQEVLGLSADQFGLLLTAGALGGVVGSFTASRVARALGSGTSLFVTLLGSGLTLGITGVTSSALVVWAMFLAGSYLVVLWNVITVSLRQTIIPDRLLGRVNSVYRMFAWGMIPIGSLLGGLIVAVVEPLAGRETALRTPFFVGAGVYLVLYVIALPILNTRQIEQARREALPR